MGLLNLIANTVEGALEATINASKAAVGVAIAPLDAATTLEEGLDGIGNGLSKIGNTQETKDAE
ncbi:MAG: hypothetical protein ACRCUC_02245 [Aestuariivirga sp.]